MSASSSASPSASSVLSSQESVPRVQAVEPVPTPGGGAALSVWRVPAVVRLLWRLARHSRPDDERIAQHRDAVYRRLERLPLL